MARKIRTDLHGHREFLYHGITIQHHPNETYFLDSALALRNFQTFIEIGTHRGGITLLFCIHAMRRKGKVLTIDINAADLFYDTYMPNLFILTADCFSEQSIELIKKFIATGRTLIYCDGGNKINEFNYFATLLKPNDCIMAHDRGTEIRIQNIEHTVRNNNLVPIYEEEIKKLKCRIFAFRKENP